jgi:hypothetical protein
MNIRFGAKDAPFIWTSGTKNSIQKFNHLPPYFGGKMGRAYGKMRKKNLLMLEYLGRYDRY